MPAETERSCPVGPPTQPLSNSVSSFSEEGTAVGTAPSTFPQQMTKRTGEVLVPRAQRPVGRHPGSGVEGTAPRRQRPTPRHTPNAAERPRGQHSQHTRETVTPEPAELLVTLPRDVRASDPHVVHRVPPCTRHHVDSMSVTRKEARTRAAAHSGLTTAHSGTRAHTEGHGPRPTGNIQDGPIRRDSTTSRMC